MATVSPSKRMQPPLPAASPSAAANAPPRQSSQPPSVTQAVPSHSSASTNTTDPPSTAASVPSTAAAAAAAAVPPVISTPRGKRREASKSPTMTAESKPSQTPATPAQPNPNTPGPTSIEREISSPKRLRAPQPAVKMMPANYEDCNVQDLIVLISNMLMELVRYNDTIPLSNGGLTRFHSRAPPGISIPDYLARLTTHATLSPPILLSMVYYIDRLCALYPAFNISSLTVHRFLIAAATVASKGLSDAFWTNNTYARVGGVSLRELALLELEFLWRVEWRIVPKPEVLVDYYRSLVQRSEGFAINDTTDTGAESNLDAMIDAR